MGARVKSSQHFGEISADLGMNIHKLAQNA